MILLALIILIISVVVPKRKRAGKKPYHYKGIHGEGINEDELENRNL